MDIPFGYSDLDLMDQAKDLGLIQRGYKGHKARSTYLFSADILLRTGQLDSHLDCCAVECKVKVK